MVVIGIDESYTRTGITVLEDKKLLKMYSVNFDGCKNNYDKRKDLRSVLESILNELLREYKPIEIKCIIERIRTFSGGHMSSQYLITTGGLIVTILDVFLAHNIKVYSVDTKAWKNAVIGTSKPKENKYGINPNKYPTILYLNFRLYKRYLFPTLPQYRIVYVFVSDFNLNSVPISILLQSLHPIVLSSLSFEIHPIM